MPHPESLSITSRTNCFLKLEMRLGDLKCETSGWDNITFGSQGDIGIIHSFSDFHLRMTPCDLELFGGGGLQ